MKTEFEQLLLQHLKTKYKAGYYDPTYHIAKYEKGIKKGRYINPETQWAWEWYQRGLDRITERSQGYFDNLEKFYD